jgi:tetratricopeptide (TPR) repeat protein
MLSTFEAQGDQPGLARAWRLLGVVYGTTGQFSRAAEAASNVVDSATRVGDARLAARAAVTYSLAALYSSMPVPEALQRAEALLGAVETDRIAKARFLGILAVLHAMQGRFDEARELYRRSQGIVAELGRSLTVAAASLESSRVEMLAGDPSAAERELMRDYAILQAVDERYYRSSIACLLGHALWSLERYQDAGRYIDVAQDLADPDDVFTQVFWRTGRAKLWARDGRGPEAVALAREAVDMASASDDIEQRADAICDLAEVVRLAGDSATEGTLLREAFELYERKGDLVSAAGVAARLNTGARTQ